MKTWGLRGRPRNTDALPLGRRTQREMTEPALPEPRAYILGGNANTLAFVSSLVPENRQITAWLVPIAWTPIGVVIGENWQQVNIAADNVPGWADQTFSPDDERSFVSSLRDLEMLAADRLERRDPDRIGRGGHRQSRGCARRRARRHRPPARSAHRSARSAGARACATTSCGTSAACAPGITTRPCSASAARGATDPTKTATSRRCPRAKYVARRLARRRRRRCGARDRRDRRGASAGAHQQVMAADPGAHLAVRTEGGYTVCCASGRRRAETQPDGPRDRPAGNAVRRPLRIARWPATLAGTGRRAARSTPMRATRAMHSRRSGAARS